MSDIALISEANTAANIERVIKRVVNINAASTDMWDGLAVSAAVSLYRKSGCEALRRALLSKADDFLKEETIELKDISEIEYSSAPCLLYEAYKITGEDKYKEKAVALEKSDSYMGLAFDMMHETLFGGKEHYHAITLKFTELAERERQTDIEKAMFMEALINTIEAIDQPVYELYRSLVDIFRKELKKLMCQGTDDTLIKDAKAELIFAHAIRKACDMKVILAEKYEHIADGIYDRYQEKDCAYIINYAQRM